MASNMTDKKRDNIDEEVENFIKLCNDVIKILRVEIRTTSSEQYHEHQINAILMVEHYVKLINEFHNKQKAIRLRRNLDAQNFFRLSKPIKSEVEKYIKPSESSNNRRKSLSDTSDSGVSEMSLRKRKVTFQKPDNESKSDHLHHGASNRSLNPSTLHQSSSKSTITFNPNEEDEQKSEELNNFTAEELQKFKTESEVIYQQMNSMNQEVRDVAKKLNEISKLQEAFSENVLKQEMDLNQLNTTTINSTEAIRQGNESLRSAMRKNAAFRIMILFTTTLLAFVLLFLHWYNE